MVAPSRCREAIVRKPPHLILHFGDQPHTTARHLARAVERLGWHVTFQGAGHPPNEVEDDIPLLWVESGRPSLPRDVQFGSRRTGAWIIDSHRGLEWRKEIARAFETVFVAQRAATNSLKTAGVTAEWLPLAFPADINIAGEVPTVDVDFVGNVSPGSDRDRILRPIASRYGIPIGEYVSPSEMVRRYARARIVVNVPLARDLNMRLFEAAGAGAHVVTGPMEGVGDILPTSCFTSVDSHDPDEWIAVIQQLLADRDALDDRRSVSRDAIAMAHTYDHRARVIMERLSAEPENPVPIEQRRRSVLRAAAVLGLPSVAATVPQLPIGSRLSSTASASGVRTRRLFGAARRTVRSRRH